MSRRLGLIVFLCGLAACGVDGEPVQPTVAASVGVGSSGVSTNLGVGVHTGPISVFLGL